MDYSEYIELKFTRLDFKDEVEFDRLGRNAFLLTRKVNGRVDVAASSEKLDKPMLYIKIGDTEYHHVIDIPETAVRDIFADEK